MRSKQAPVPTTCRNLVLILGDQLDLESSALQGFDTARDVVLMIEAVEESTHVWSHKARTALFLSAMRHYAEALRARDLTVIYRTLDKEADASLAAGITAVVKATRPQRLIVVEPGDRRVEAMLHATCEALQCPLEVRLDTHFMSSKADFARWAGRSKTLRLEFFYREMRRQYRVLMDGDQPVGGAWNFDAENRKGFGKAGPKDVPTTPRFTPDAITKEVIELVNTRFADHPGKLTHFNWPVTREEALIALEDFIIHRLAKFGDHQDAMWTHLPFGWHSLLSTSLNLKLLTPREVVLAAERAYQRGAVSLPTAEGFIRQILGWREFIRGVYFLDGDTLKNANHFGHDNKLPKWYWTGDVHMNCMHQSIEQTLEYGYAHHIQRLMITGMFGVLAELTPQALCDWYLAVYVDAVEWVELPNTAGMALFANGGRFTSKPYVASGAYVKRMSNYCDGCRYKPEQRAGVGACPMTTLYWNFLDRHEKMFAGNPRTALMIKNLAKMSDDERAEIRAHAANLLADLDAL
ncbi:MAG: cryptochrome/photolyase family protein [Burkholderiales bacterium]